MLIDPQLLFFTTPTSKRHLGILVIAAVMRYSSKKGSRLCMMLDTSRNALSWTLLQQQ